MNTICENGTRCLILLWREQGVHTHLRPKMFRISDSPVQILPPVFFFKRGEQKLPNIHWAPFFSLPFMLAHILKASIFLHQVDWGNQVTNPWIHSIFIIHWSKSYTKKFYVSSQAVLPHPWRILAQFLEKKSPPQPQYSQVTLRTLQFQVPSATPFPSLFLPDRFLVFPLLPQCSSIVPVSPFCFSNLVTTLTPPPRETHPQETLTPKSRYSAPVGLASPFRTTAEQRLPFELPGVCEAVCGSGVWGSMHYACLSRTRGRLPCLSVGPACVVWAGHNRGGKCSRLLFKSNKAHPDR